MDEIIRAVSKDGFVKISVVTARDAVPARQRHPPLQPDGDRRPRPQPCARRRCSATCSRRKTARSRCASAAAGASAPLLPCRTVMAMCAAWSRTPRSTCPRARMASSMSAAPSAGTACSPSAATSVCVSRMSAARSSSAARSAEDLSAYLVESEQIPAACGLGVLVDTDHSVKAAGGFLVQLMPGAPEELITKLEDNIFMMDQLTTILDEDGADAILPQVMRGLEPEIVLRHPMTYRCACSRARVEQALRPVRRAGAAGHDRRGQRHAGALPVLRRGVCFHPGAAADAARCRKR